MTEEAQTEVVAKRKAGRKAASKITYVIVFLAEDNTVDMNRDILVTKDTTQLLDLYKNNERFVSREIVQ
jgi:hypothetical protein